MGTPAPGTSSQFEWISLPHDFARATCTTAASHVVAPQNAPPEQTSTLVANRPIGNSNTLVPSARRQSESQCTITVDGAPPKKMRRQQESDHTRVNGKHSYTLHSSFQYEQDHHVSFKVVDEDAKDEHGNKCIQLMCCGERRCRNRLGEGVGKGLLVPLTQLRNKKQNFLDHHVLHHLPDRQGSADREDKRIQQMAIRTRDLERAWLWHGGLPALQIARTATAAEAWAERHLRSSQIEDAFCGTAIVIDRAIKVLPPVLSWLAGSSDDLPDDRREYAMTDGLFAFLEEQAGGGLKLQTPIAAQKPTIASLRSSLREAIHPSIEMQLPLISELPTASMQDTQSKKLRKALLSLLAGEETMVPRTWLRDGRTVLNMINDPSKRVALFLLVMHSNCNLEIHVDALATGMHYLHTFARQ